MRKGGVERLDRTDIRILEELQADGRLSNVDLASRIHLSPSPCLTRVKELETSGLISRYVALLDPRKIGLAVSVFINIRLEQQNEKSLEIFEAAVQKYPEIMECYLMTGDSDYMLRVLVPDVQALETFIVQELSKIKGVANIRSSFALKQVKYKTAVPIPY
jgi:Lrp/AsnC family leucine-responsive transcriptional regulator